MNKDNASQRSSKSWKAFFIRKETGSFLALILILVAFQVVSVVRQWGQDDPRHFVSAGTAGTVLTPTAELGIVALGATMLMIAGEFDLSVGSLFAMAGMINGAVTRSVLESGLIQEPALATLLAFVLALCFGVVAGSLNGWLTLKTRIPSFIVTLGSMMFWRGAVLLLSSFITGGRPITLTREEWGNWATPIIGGTRIDVFPDFLVLDNVGVGIFWFLGLVALFWYILKKTKAGNWIFATGGKKEAAMALGIPVHRVKLMMFALSGLLATLAGSIQFARAHSMSSIEGTGLELEAIASAVIGGAALTGGVGTVIGTLFGALTLRTIKIGLPAIGLDSKMYQMVVGVILFAAVVINQKLNEFSEKRR